MTPWARAITALRLCQIDPAGLGGILLHARAGPVRDAFTAQIQPHQRLHPAMSADALTGGIDVAASLVDGTLVRQKGLLETVLAPLILPMAERTPPLMASQLATWLDRDPRSFLVALDEHTEDDPAPPAALTDRLAFHVDLGSLCLADVDQGTPDADPRRVPVSTSEAHVEALVVLAAELGVMSLRAPFLALSAAKAHATLSARTSVTDEDITAAAELVLAPRATRIPAPEETPPPPDQSQTSQTEPHNAQAQDALPQDLLLAAIATALPVGLLSDAATGPKRASAGSGAGQKRIGNRRGRPLPPRDGGTPSGSARVDLMATLRAAVPWQTLRRQTQTRRIGPIIHPSDLRYKRYETLSDRLVIFAVDASGSAALARLAEAKGAIEHLLAEAYARRDHVALISFRGTDAEVLLPPTRSLVQTKRRLADLPGGGGTPLASGLKAAFEMSDSARRKGMSPVLVLLTDGRSNIALDGTPDRAQARSDATAWAERLARAETGSIVIDTGRRPERALRDLAASLRGQYVSLPRADARAVSETVTTALER